MLREWDLQNEGSFKFVDIDEEGGVAQEGTIGEPKFNVTTFEIIVETMHLYARIKSRANGDVDKGGTLLTLYGKFHINLGGQWDVDEIDTGVVDVVRLRHVECVRIAGGQIVVARAIEIGWITEIFVLLVAFVTVVASDSFCGATAFSTFTIAEITVSITGARCAGATVDWISIEAFDAFLTIGTFGKITTRPVAHVGMSETLAVAIALALGTVDEVPVGGWTSSWLQHFMSVVDGKWSLRGSLQANSHTGSGTIVTPATLWVL